MKIRDLEKRDVSMDVDEKHTEKESDGILDYFSITSLAVVCAVAGTLLVLGVVFVAWCRRRNRRNKLLYDLTFDGNESLKITKSAPNSRSPSPKLNKRMSCPDALSNQGARGMIVRSVASDKVPDFTLPPERVQPYSEREKRSSTSSSRKGSRSDSVGSIKPDLYHHQSFSEDEEPNLPKTSHGRLWFSLVHDPESEQLNVTLIKVKDLPGRENNQQPRDPFVKIFLLPDEKACRTSKVKKKTLSPTYNETHCFQVSESAVRERVLRFSVYDVDRRRVRHSLGHVMINLKNLDLCKGDVMWSDLEAMVQTAASSLGELQISLVYLPQNEKIKIAIHKAKNVKNLDGLSELGTYIKAQLFYAHKCHRVKRTLTVKGQTEPAFNESLTFTVHGKQLDSCNMVISLMLSTQKVYGTTEVEYGRIVIGPFMYARGDGLVHWQEMLSRSKTPVTRWHPFCVGPQQE